MAAPSPFLSMRRNASAMSAQLSHAGWTRDVCLGTDDRGAILIPASEDKVKLKSSGNGSTQNSDTWFRNRRSSYEIRAGVGWHSAATLEYLAELRDRVS